MGDIFISGSFYLFDWPGSGGLSATHGCFSNCHDCKGTDLLGSEEKEEVMET